MNKFLMECPKCGASLEAEDELDSFFCKYCGAKILLDDATRREAMLRMKELEFQRKQKELEADVEKHRINQTTKRKMMQLVADNIPLAFLFGMAFIGMIILCIMGMHDSKVEKREEKRVQTIYEEAQEYYYSEDYDNALEKANMVIFDSSIDSDKAAAWNKKRNILISSIKEAKDIEPQMIKMPEKADYYRGKDYKDVVTAMESLGYIDISTEYVTKKSVGNMFISSQETLEVSINGTTDFKVGDEFPENATVVIRYKY